MGTITGARVASFIPLPIMTTSKPCNPQLVILPLPERSVVEVRFSRFASDIRWKELYLSG
jgi:hypothetical protein